MVTFNSKEAVRRSLPPLAAQLQPEDELIVVDNASSDGTVDAIAGLAADAVVVERNVNQGFACAVNIAAAQASGDLLVLLNPDVVPAADFCAEIRRPLEEGRGWGAWMGLVTAQQGRLVNTTGGVIHFTGIAWAGEAGRPMDGLALEPGEVAFASGACMAVPAAEWRARDGFAEEYFMYHEDVDFSLRLRLAGRTIGIQPAARVDHAYEFLKGPQKWHLLERNRLATVIRTYPAPLLALVAPALIATELALLPVSLRGRWARQKVRATAGFLRRLPGLLAQRRSIMASRVISSADFADHLTGDLSSIYLGRARRSAPLAALLRAYWRVVVALLSVGRLRPVRAVRRGCAGERG
jgi:GT2 family glycosyltransferase